MDSTTYSTMQTLEHVAALLGVNLEEVQPLPALSLPVLSLNDEDGVQGQSPCIDSTR